MAVARYIDKELGPVTVQLRAATSRMSAKWTKGGVKIIAPYGTKAEAVYRFVDSSREWLRAHRPKAKFEFGGRLDVGSGRGFVFMPIDEPNRIRTSVGDGGMTLIVGITRGADLTSGEVMASVSKVLHKAAAYFGEALLIEPCRAEARRLGLRPASVSISTGQRTLGTCSRDGHIRISASCVFLTPELRRFIFCHELAHLTHHDHSAAFHALLDRYLAGEEARLVAALNSYDWPLLR